MCCACLHGEGQLGITHQVRGWYRCCNSFNHHTSAWIQSGVGWHTEIERWSTLHPCLCLGQKEQPFPEVPLQNREDTLGVGKEEDVSNGQAPEGHHAKLIQPPTCLRTSATRKAHEVSVIRGCLPKHPFTTRTICLDFAAYQEPMFTEPGESYRASSATPCRVWWYCNKTAQNPKEIRCPSDQC